jgi:hypothetical protein
MYYIKLKCERIFDALKVISWPVFYPCNRPGGDAKQASHLHGYLHAASPINKKCTAILAYRKGLKVVYEVWCPVTNRQEVHCNFSVVGKSPT